MSVYSGFATRKQEELYNSFIEQLIKELSSKLTQFTNLSEDVSFKKNLYQILKKMQVLEENKYIFPKYSEATKSLQECLQLFIPTTESNNGSSVLKKQNKKRQNDKTRESESKYLVIKEETERSHTFIDSSQNLKKDHKLPIVVNKRAQSMIKPRLINTSFQETYHHSFDHRSPYAISQLPQQQKKQSQTIDQTDFRRKKRKNKKVKLDQSSAEYKFDKVYMSSSARNSPSDRVKVLRKTFMQIDKESRSRFEDLKGNKSCNQSKSLVEGVKEKEQ